MFFIFEYLAKKKMVEFSETVKELLDNGLLFIKSKPFGNKEIGLDLEFGTFFTQYIANEYFHSVNSDLQNLDQVKLIVNFVSDFLRI